MQLTDPPGGRQVLSGVRSWCLGIAIVTACSWVRCLATGSPKVDENYPSLAAGTVIFLGLVAGWTSLVWGWQRLLAHPPPPAVARRLAFVGVLLALPMLPMLSNDVYGLLLYGSVAAHGHDVFTTGEWLPGSAFFAWVGERWGAQVFIYGPTTLVAALPAGVAGPNAWLALFVLRFTWLVPLVAAMEISFRRMPDRPLFHAMVWLNPLFVVQGLGQLHADVLGLAALATGIALQVRGRRWGGWCLGAIAVFCKYTFLFTTPWFWLFGAEGTRQRAARVFAMGAVIVGVGVLLYAPFWSGPATLTTPLRTLDSSLPGGSITEVAGHLVHVLRGGAVPPATLPPRVAVEMERAAKGPTWLVVSLILRFVFAGVALRQLQGMLRRRSRDDELALGTGTLVVAGLTLASQRFHSWYLLTAAPFFGFRCEGPWRLWWVLAVGLSVATEFIHVLPRSAALLPIWSVLTNGGVVAVFLWSFRERFLRLPPSAEPLAEAPVAAP